MMVERRDQALMISLLPGPRDVSAFFSWYLSSNGPFQTEPDTDLATIPLLVTGAPDHLSRLLVAARLRTLGLLSPRGHRMAAAGGAAFAAAVRMVDRVHGHAAHRRALAQPAVAAGLAELGVGLIRVGHRPDRGHALRPHHAHLAGAQAQQRVAGVAADELHIGAGGARDLAAPARLHLHLVDDGSHPHCAPRHAVARLLVPPI